MKRNLAWVDVVTGKMTLEEAKQEIFNYMLGRNPRRLVVDIRLMADGYHVTLWVSRRDFEKVKK